MGNLTAFTKRDLAQIVKLLGYLQNHLEIVIENHPDAKIVRAAQVEWRRAENMVKRLEACNASTRNTD